MDEKVEQPKQKKSFKPIPQFWQDMIGSALILYSTVTEPARFGVAQDVLGYVDAIIHYTRAKYDKNVTEKTYAEDIEEARKSLTYAITQYRDGGNAADALISLGSAMDLLKKIIISRDMIAEGYDIRSNPLGSQSLADDIQSKNYRKV